MPDKTPSLGEAMSQPPDYPGDFKGDASKKGMEHHPGYVVRFDMQTGAPYYVPIGSPRSKHDRDAQERYDNDAYNSSSISPGYGINERGSGHVFDPDTGKNMPVAELMNILSRRYPKQTATDWNVGGNVRQPVVPGQGARRAVNLNLNPDGSPIPTPGMIGQ